MCQVAMRDSAESETPGHASAILVSPRLMPSALYAVALKFKDDPTQFRILETYAGVAAYKAHLEAPHFKKSKTVTQGMVKSLKLVETDPIMLGAKGK